MSDMSEPKSDSESEKENRAPHTAARDETSAKLTHNISEPPLPSRLFAIFSGLEEPTPEEKTFLVENPRYQEIGEQMAKRLKELQAKSQNQRSDVGRDR
jgi:hypothetical protein